MYPVSPRYGRRTCLLGEHSFVNLSLTDTAGEPVCLWELLSCGGLVPRSPSAGILMPVYRGERS